MRKPLNYNPTVLGVTSQTPFTYLVSVMDHCSGGRGGGGRWRKKSCKGRVYECVLQVSCKFHTRTREKGKVSQNLLARIVASKRAFRQNFQGQNG